jgi:hypothetical protein
MIPHSWIERIENRADFVGVLILDLWANNCDRRQVVFLSDDNDRLHASFIDNDYLFWGKVQSLPVIAEGVHSRMLHSSAETLTS